jgi:phosphatidylglycerol:prolipoprotein diacylglycerol transferase
MIPYFSLIKIGVFYTWGMFLALGILTSFVFALSRAKKEKIPTQIFWDLLLWILVGIIIGARMGYVIQFIGKFKNNLRDILKIWDGGMTFYGGLFGGAGSFFLFFKRNKEINEVIFKKIMDISALSLPIGIAVGRIGCFLINDHLGRETRFFWGIAWPDGSIRHPVALYLIINALLIFLILSLLKDKLKKPGLLFYYFLVIYSFTRFFLDLTRGSESSFSDPSFLWFSVSQWISVFLFVFSFHLILKNKRRG